MRRENGERRAGVEFLGLQVSPDLDTVLYTLAGLLDEERGWGVRDETTNALAIAERLGADSWFTLGDRDIGLHLVRTSALRSGEPLSTVTARIAAALGVETRHEEKVSPALSAVMILGGLGTMVAGRRRPS